MPQVLAQVLHVHQTSHLQVDKMDKKLCTEMLARHEMRENTITAEGMSLINDLVFNLLICCRIDLAGGREVGE